MQCQCSVCGYVYNMIEGDADGQIPPATSWEYVPDEWCCPECSASKLEFEVVEKEESE